MMLKTGKINPYKVIVCGAGHAGCEAALASARMGLDTLLITGNLDTIAQMSCNPSIGGLAKGHIVREIDALGGEMAVNADAAGIHFKVLNASKGPAVQSPRAQCDKKAYQFRMKRALEAAKNLALFQGQGTELLTEGGKARGVRTNMGVDFYADAVILTTGTFLRGLMHIGFTKTEGGRMGDFAAKTLSNSLKECGIEIERLKTGTPARILGSSINFDKCAPQPGDSSPCLFGFYETYDPAECGVFHVEHLTLEERIAAVQKAKSFGNFEGFGHGQLKCFETDTTKETAEVILKNLKKSAMYGGAIEGVGPRYCPSIEDKIVRFADKETHRLFLEPEGRDTDEWYINGLSTSMPIDVQLQIIRSVTGLENAQMMRPAYAVEYDYAPPTQLSASLESRVIENLFCAGQINGTSGYEEAAGQGLIAGANAAAKLLGLEPLILKRHESYIGVLIDDLVTKGTKEPYRMFTSRAEYRLLLNHTSAEARLYKYAKKYALAGVGRLANIEAKNADIERLANAIEGGKEAAVLRRQEADTNLHALLGSDFCKLPQGLRDEVLYRVIYRGYLERDMRQLEKMSGLEEMSIPPDMTFSKALGLRIEAAQKLEKFKPATIGQASRISGISPADVSVLAVAVKSFISKTHTKKNNQYSS